MKFFFKILIILSIVFLYGCKGKKEKEIILDNVDLEIQMIASYKAGIEALESGDALFAANRISASVREKARTHPLRLAGLVGNRTSKRDLIQKYIESCPMPVLEVLPLIEDIRVSRVKGKTLFEMAESDPSLNYV